MEKGKESEGKLEELQLYEQNLQNLVLQKQILQADLNEINSALKEVAKSKDECFKIVGGIMIKIPKDEIIKDLEEKKKLQELRIKSFEKQEEMLKKHSQALREELMKKLKNNI